MKKRKIAAGLLASLIAVVPSVMHAEDCCAPSYLPGKPLCDPCVIYGAYAGPELNCGWDVFAYGEFLYWSATRTTSIVAISSPTGPGNTQDQFRQKFDYRPGFRIGIGMALPNFDNWILTANYLWYHHSFTGTLRATAPNTLGTTLPVAPQTGVGLFGSGGLFTGFPMYRSIRNKTVLHYDVVSVNIQRPNYFGQRVIISPFLGLKWLTRNVKFSQDLTQAATGLVDRQHTNWKYSSIGPAAGVDGSWLLCWGLRLIGKGDVALMYAYDYKKLSEVGTSSDGTVLRYKSPRSHMDLWGVGGMGLGWGEYFCCNRYYLDFSATWDIAADVSKLLLHTGMFLDGSVVLYGLTVHAQFDF